MLFLLRQPCIHGLDKGIFFFSFFSTRSRCLHLLVMWVRNPLCQDGGFVQTMVGWGGRFGCLTACAYVLMIVFMVETREGRFASRAAAVEDRPGYGARSIPQAHQVAFAGNRYLDNREHRFWAEGG
ncbi:hypothetical protein L209DRAFT_598890 [Thermothelomyces heterothallicus CBS 203.75]